MLLVVGSLFDVFRAYAASKGLLATGIILSKTDEVPNKAIVRIHKFQLAFRTRNNQPITANIEVDGDSYDLLNPRDSVQLRYAARNPTNVILASGGWFPWRLLGIAPLGIILLITAITSGTKRPT